MDYCTDIQWKIYCIVFADMKKAEIFKVLYDRIDGRVSKNDMQNIVP